MFAQDSLGHFFLNSWDNKYVLPAPAPKGSLFIETTAATTALERQFLL
jgi:hypothetical protein